MADMSREMIEKVRAVLRASGDVVAVGDFEYLLTNNISTPPESGGQGEAVYQYRVRSMAGWSPWYEVHVDGYERANRGEALYGFTQEATETRILYTHPTAQASGAVTEEVAKRIYYMRRDFDLSTVERSHFWARECRDIVEALAQGVSNER